MKRAEEPPPTRMDEKVVIIERCDLKRYNLINDVDLQGVGGRTRFGLTAKVFLP